MSDIITHLTSEEQLTTSIQDQALSTTISEETVITTTVESEQTIGTTLTDETDIKTAIEFDKTVVPGVAYTVIQSSTTRTIVDNTNFTISVELLPEVLEPVVTDYGSKAEFPNIGKPNHLYIDTSADIGYRWDSSNLIYQPISDSWRKITIIDGGKS